MPLRQIMGHFVRQFRKWPGEVLQVGCLVAGCTHSQELPQILSQGRSTSDPICL